MKVDSGQPGHVHEPLPVSAKLGYGIADFGLSLAFNLPSFFLLYYFTDVFAISAAAAGLILFTAKLWDAFISPVMGSLSDYTVTRWGNKRPYLLFGALPAAVSIALLYSSPEIASAGGRIAWGLAVFTLFCTVMTVIIVPFSALTADMTVDPHERSVLSAFRMVFAVAGTLAAAAATRPLVVLLGGGGIAGEVKGFRIVGVLYGAVLALAVLATFALIRERTHTDRDARFSLRDDLKVVLHNRPFIILTLGVMMHQTALNTMSTVVVYFFKYNLRAEAMIPVAFLCLMVSSVASIPFFLWLSKTRGKKYSYNLGMGILAAFAVPIFLYAERSMAAALAFFFVVGLGIGTTYLSPWSMIPDTVEYSQWKTGLRREGTLYGVFYFSYKLSVAVPGLLVGAVLKMSGYVPNSAQGPGALLGIKALLTVVPMVFVIAGIVLISRFPITDELHRRMVREIRERAARP